MSKGDASAAAEEVQGDQSGGCCWSLGGGCGWFGEVGGPEVGRGRAGAWGLAGPLLFALVGTGQMVIPQAGVGPVSVTSVFAEASP